MARNNNNSKSGDMSVRDAGRKGGQRTSETHGTEFYQEIGQKGGERVRDLIDKGKEHDNENR